VTDRFSEVLSVVLGFEGGYADDPDDRGGRTNYGITEGTLRSAYERKIVSHKDIRSLSKADAALIYWSDYWEPVKGDLLPEPLDLILFDCAVNHGVGGAVKLLQEGLNSILKDTVLAVDGAMGPRTRAALATLRKEDARLTNGSGDLKPYSLLRYLCLEVLMNRTRLYDRLVDRNVSQRKFLRGWIHNRVVKLGKSAGLED